MKVWRVHIPLSIFSAVRWLLLCLAVCFFNVKAIAQQKSRFEIRQISIPSINIRCIAEDANGFVWIGSQDGLLRFDSKEFRLYNKGGEARTAIGGSDIRDMAESNEAIWMTSTQGGIDKISKTTSNVLLHIPQSRFPGLGNNTITSLVNHDSVLYIGTEKGLYKYHQAGNTIVPIPLRQKATYIDKLAIAGDYLVVMVRDWGCISYQISKASIADEYSTTPAHRFYSLAAYAKGEWLLGTSQGINKVRLNAQGKLQYEKAPFSNVGQSIGTDVYAVCVDKHKNIWFSNENNLIRIDAGGLRYSIIDNTRESAVEFLNNVYKIFCDKDDNIWLCCQTGLFYLKNKPALMVAYHRSDAGTTSIPHAYYILPVNDSIAFVTAENGLYRINIDQRIVEAIDVSQVYDFAFVDPFKKLLVSNKTGLKKLKGRTCIAIERVYKEFTAFKEYTINSAVQINPAEVVMGTENNSGILVWNFVDHTVRNINSRSTEMPLDNDIINGVFKLRDNVFCVLSESSLIYIDYSAKTSRRIPLIRPHSNEEYGLLFDMCRVKESYYLSSYGNGVLVLDTNFRIKQVISTGNGLSNNSVYKLLPWKDSLVFMTTNFGLNVLDVRSGKITQYFKSDGLHDNVFEETSGNVFSNKVYAGGANGITVIYPDYLHADTTAPLLFVNHVTIDLPGKTVDSTNLQSTQFFIPADALQTNIHFSGINFRDPERTSYRYRILELHTNWISPGGRNFVTLMGMAPGTYHLEVQAFNKDGKGSGIKSLSLIFLPRWYQTWWFKLALLIAVIGAVYSLYQFRIRQLKQVQGIRNKLASDLHDDLGSTMNSVKIFANLALMDKQPDKYILKIKESTQEAITGIRDMIWVLDDKKDEMEHLLTRIGTFAAPLCEANGISYKQEISDDARDHNLDQEERRNLYMICKEAVNNAIKYAGATTIELKLFLSKGKPQVVIADNGKGFSWQTVHQGNGLKNMVRRAAEIKYHLTIRPVPGDGTMISLSKM